MTILPESDRYLEAAYDEVNRFTVERERRQVAKAALEAARVVAEQLRPKKRPAKPTARRSEPCRASLQSGAA